MNGQPTGALVQYEAGAEEDGLPAGVLMLVALPLKSAADDAQIELRAKPGITCSVNAPLHRRNRHVLSLLMAP